MTKSAMAPETRQGEQDGVRAGVVTVSAYPLAGTTPDWAVTAFAICATVL